jgi:predicted O-linked N-acetylglucosamine transferase (SPINDLY family)
MGVPVVTKLGNSLSTRIGGAILSTIDMTDWIARDGDEYVDIALQSAPTGSARSAKNFPIWSPRAAARRPTRGRRRRRIG